MCESLPVRRDKWNSQLRLKLWNLQDEKDLLAREKKRLEREKYIHDLTLEVKAATKRLEEA